MVLTLCDLLHGLRYVDRLYIIFRGDSDWLMSLEWNADIAYMNRAELKDLRYSDVNSYVRFFCDEHYKVCAEINCNLPHAVDPDQLFASGVFVRKVTDPVPFYDESDFIPEQEVFADDCND